MEYLLGQLEQQMRVFLSCHEPMPHLYKATRNLMSKVCIIIVNILGWVAMKYFTSPLAT